MFGQLLSELVESFKADVDNFDTSVLADQYGLRDRFGLIRAGDFAFRVEHDGNGDFHLFQKVVDLIGLFPDIDRIHHDSRVGHRLGNFGDDGHCLDTRAAPCCPEVEHDDFATQLAQLKRLAIEQACCEIGCF